MLCVMQYFHIVIHLEIVLPTILLNKRLFAAKYYPKMKMYYTC